MSSVCLTYRIALVGALVAVGCSDDGAENSPSTAGSGGSAAAGASGGGSQAGDGGGGGGAGAAGTAGMAGQLPDTPVECDDDAIACRGACFREVGEAHNGCELIARSDSDSGIEAIAVTEQAIFAIDSAWQNLSAPPGRLFRFDPPDYRVTELKIENRFENKLVVDGGFLYVNAGYTDEDGAGNLGLARIALDGGEIELLVDPFPERADAVDFEVLDGYVWYYIDGLHRVPVTGGEPELILDRNIDSIALDATHLYFHVAFPDFDLERSPRSDPTQNEVLVDNVTSAQALMLDADPDHVYYYDGEYARVPKTGGTPEVLSDRRLRSLVAQVGPDHLFVTLVSASLGQPGCYAISKQDGAVLRIDDSAASPQQLGEDAQAFYIGRRNGLLRIAKDAL